MGTNIRLYPRPRVPRGATRSNRGVGPTHAALRRHPNFTFPELPSSRSRAALVNFVLESVARFVSPPKLWNEDEEFACEDIAEAIRTKLKPELLAMLTANGGRL